MIVKVCGITTLRDAEFAVNAGANALGFNFYHASPRYVAPAAAAAITSSLPAAVLKVGVFVNELPATIESLIGAAGLDVAQIIDDGGNDMSGMRRWRVHRVDAGFTAASLDADPGAEAFLLDTPSATLYGGTGQTFDWERARIPSRKILIAGGLGPDNVAAAIRAAQPWGVDACSRLESAPGRKDPAKVKAFVQSALSV